MKLLRVVLAAAACVAFAAANVAADELYKPKDGRFSVKFPGKPKETPQKTSSTLGELSVVTATFATTEGNVFLVSYTDFPAGSLKPETQTALFDGVRDGLKKDKDAQLVSEKDGTLGAAKLPMREIVVKKPKQTLRFRVAIRGDRLYQVAVVGSDDFVKSKEAVDFLDSFEVIP